MASRAATRLLVAGALLASCVPHAAPIGASPAAEATATNACMDVSTTRYHTVSVDGLEVFYREAGPRDAPVVLLLHGFPASSFMYRDLITLLAGCYRVIAPDYPGFGYSAAPPAEEYTYTFDRLADVIEQFTDQLGLSAYAIYMQDFGGPVGLRLASRHPEKVTALITQNANAYAEGLPDDFWAFPKSVWRNPTAENLAQLRDQTTSPESLQWNYTHGVKDPRAINPDNWYLQQALVNRPGNKDIMLALLYDYRTNPERYPEWQAYFRKHQPPMLIVWGKNDEIFPPSGARAYLKDLPHAELHLLDTGHFALEEESVQIARHMHAFLDRIVGARMSHRADSGGH